MEMLFVAVALLIFLTALFLAAPLPALWLVSGIGLIGLQRLSDDFCADLKDRNLRRHE